LIDKVKPALDAVTTALSMFDAAKAGQEIGAFFVGAGNGMKLFQKAVDEFKTGNFTEGFKAMFEAIKLQVMETADSIYTKLVAAFKTVGGFVAEMFKSDGALFTTVIDGARLAANKITEEVTMALAKAFNGSYLTKGLSDNLADASYEAKAAGTAIGTSLIGSGRRITEQFEKAGGSISDSFNKNLKETAPLFDVVIKKQNDVVKGTDALISADEEFEKQTMDRIDKDVAASQKAFAEKVANQQTLAKDQTAEDERAANARKKYEDDHKVQAELKREEIALQIKINEAIANGDTKLADSLKTTQSLNKTIKEFADSGLKQATNEAENLAKALALSAREADRVKNSLATKIGEDVKKRQESEAIDPNGRLQKKAQEQIAAGQYKAAEATGQQLANRELEAAVRGTGSEKDRRASGDILKDYYGEKAPTGLTSNEQNELIRKARDEGQYKDTSKMTDLSKKGLDRFADLVPDEKKQAALDKAKKGMEKGVPETQKDMGDKMQPQGGGGEGEGDKGDQSVLSAIKTAVEAIKTAVEKIEPKLPTAALSA
jgi:hypothetical protein